MRKTAILIFFFISLVSFGQFSRMVDTLRLKRGGSIYYLRISFDTVFINSDTIIANQTGGSDLWQQTGDVLSPINANARIGIRTSHQTQALEVNGQVQVDSVLTYGTLTMGDRPMSGYVVWDVRDNVFKLLPFAEEPADTTTQLVYYKKVHLTAAQVNDLHDTPITLLAAPGSGKYQRILFIQTLITVTTPLTIASLDYLVGQYYVAGIPELPCSDCPVSKLSEAKLETTTTKLFTMNNNYDEYQIMVNNNFKVRMLNTNPTGSATMDFYITYQIITQ